MLQEINGSLFSSKLLTFRYKTFSQLSLTTLHHRATDQHYINPPTHPMIPINELTIQDANNAAEEVQQNVCPRCKRKEPTWLYDKIALVLCVTIVSQRNQLFYLLAQ